LRAFSFSLRETTSALEASGHRILRQKG
jgi:hypothetical protein